MWEELTIPEKTKVMRFFLQNGVSSIDRMREYYNSASFSNQTTSARKYSGKEDTESEYFGDSINSSKVTAELSRNQWNNLYRQGKVSFNEVPRKYQSWIEGENSSLKQSVAETINNAGNKIMPIVLGAATGGVGGAVAGLANTAFDMGINTITKGKSNSWGEALINFATKGNAAEHPYWTMAAEVTNPMNLIDFNDNFIIDTLRELKPHRSLKLKKDNIGTVINEVSNNPSHTIFTEPPTFNADQTPILEDVMRDVMRDIVDTQRISSDRQFLKDFNRKFNRRYGYPPISLESSKTAGLAEQLVKQRLDEHNTFVRGVADFMSKGSRLTESEKNFSIAMMEKVGLDPSNKNDRILYSLIYPAPAFKNYGRADIPIYLYAKVSDDGLLDNGNLGSIYTSNSLGTGLGYTYDADPNLIGVVRRKYTLGDDRNLWFKEGDFEVGAAGGKENRLRDNEEINKYIKENHKDFYKNILEKTRKETENLYPSKINFKDPLTEDQKRDVESWKRVTNFKSKSPKLFDTIDNQYKFYKAKLMMEDLGNKAGTGYQYNFFKNMNYTPKQIADYISKSLAKKRRKIYLHNYREEKNKILSNGIPETIVPVFTLEHPIPIVPSPKKTSRNIGNPFTHMIFSGRIGEPLLDYVGRLSEFPELMKEKTGQITRQHIGINASGLSRKTWGYGGDINHYNRLFPSLSNERINSISTFPIKEASFYEESPYIDRTYEWSNNDIVNLAKVYESFSPVAYVGIKGDILGGYGHKLTPDEINVYWDSNKKGVKKNIPEETINKWLENDIQTATNSVDTIYGSDLPSYIRAAIISLGYQGGNKLIRGGRDANGNLDTNSTWGSPNFEMAVNAYKANPTKENLDAIIEQMQYRDDGDPKNSGLSNRYGLYRAMMEGKADPSKILQYKNEGTFKGYRSNKVKKK